MHYLTAVLTLIFCFSLSNSHAQIVQDDFEGSGTITNWYGDDCDINTAFANPAQQGDNLSATVLRYEDTGGQYANVQFRMNEKFDLNEKNTFSLQIYVPSSGVQGNAPLQISLKLQDGSLQDSWTTQSEIIKPITLDVWQTITFDFEHDNFINLDPSSVPPLFRTDFDKVVIQVNGENNNDPVLAYLDAINYYQTVSNDPVFDRLVWSDEFDEDGALDPVKWFHQTKLPNGGSWYNDEIQHYTDRTDNASVENGIMKIIAKKEQYTSQGFTKNYTSARLNSKFAFKYGKVEVRAKLPTGVGTWPAIWMLGKNITETGAYWQTQGFGTIGWPACGEIDIMEHWGTNQNYVQSAMHTPSSFGNTSNKGGQFIPTVSNEFHIYTLEWSAEKMVFSVDGKVHYTYNPTVKNAETWPFDAEQYILLNVAIQPIIASSFTEDAMEIDYVRVYQESMTSTDQAQIEAPVVFYPNPVDDVLTIEFPNTKQTEVLISVYDLEGKLLKTQACSIRNQQTVLRGLERLSSGVYVISYILDGVQRSGKIYKK